MAKWTGWREISPGGKTPSGPAAVGFGADVEVFVRGTDDGIHQNRRHGATWSGWSGVPGGD